MKTNSKENFEFCDLKNILKTIVVLEREC
jgi:hypothetical protein